MKKRLTDKQRMDNKKKCGIYKPLPVDTSGPLIDMKNRFILKRA